MYVHTIQRCWWIIYKVMVWRGKRQSSVLIVNHSVVNNNKNTLMSVVTFRRLVSRKKERWIIPQMIHSSFSSYFWCPVFTDLQLFATIRRRWRWWWCFCGMPVLNIPRLHQDRIGRRGEWTAPKLLWSRNGCTKHQQRITSYYSELLTGVIKNGRTVCSCGCERGNQTRFTIKEIRHPFPTTIVIPPLVNLISLTICEFQTRASTFSPLIFLPGKSWCLWQPHL